MKLTGAAIPVSRGMKVLQAAPAAYPCRSAAEKRMDWNAELADQTPLVVWRTGFREGELRVYLHSPNGAQPMYILQLEEVASFYDGLTRGVEVRILDREEHGRFGWWLAPGDPHRTIEVAGVGPDDGFLLALARRVVYRKAADDEVTNWPAQPNRRTKSCT
jgi:hypothetical protein